MKVSQTCFVVFLFCLLMIGGCNKSANGASQKKGSSGEGGTQSRRGVDIPGFGSGEESGGEGESQGGDASVSDGLGGQGMGGTDTAGEGGHGRIDECLPSQNKACNQIDDDCDGTVDEGEAEICDGIDNDCDGAEDEDQVCDIVDFSVGQSHVCVLLSNDRVRCWGRNCNGRLGRGEGANDDECFGAVVAIGDEPAEMNENLIHVDFGAFVPMDIESGGAHNCVRSQAGRIKCWGENENGELGYESRFDKGDEPRTLGINLPEVDLGLNRDDEPFFVEALSLGSQKTCAVLKTPEVNQPELQQIKCWGLNGTTSQLGQGLDSDDQVEHFNIGDQADEMGRNLLFTDLGTDEEDFILSTALVFAGNESSCALFTDGRAKCFGYNSVNVFGTQGIIYSGPQHNTGNAVSFVEIATGGQPDDILDIQVGYEHTCALIAGGQVKCWGENSFGQLGTENDTDIENQFDLILPIDFGTSVGGDPYRVIQLAVGAYHNCVLIEGGQVKCWGRNDSGQLGMGDNSGNMDIIGDQRIEMGNALRFVDLGQNALVERILIGGAKYPDQHGFTCALLSSGDLKCWGANQQGQLGQGHTDNLGDQENEMGNALLPILY